MTLFYPGIAGKRPGKPTFVIIHNDAGSINACASYYKEWLPNHEAELGFAHVYIAKDSKYQADDFDNIAWHSGNSFANEWALSWEVCQSMGASDADFKAVEEAVFKDVAVAMKKYGLTPNRETVRLHKEYSATDCPHRSWALHGSAINAVQDYFIAGIKKYMTDNSQNTEDKGEITMFLIKGLDANRKPQHWFISNGLDVNHVNTTRMLAEYQNKGARMNLPTSTLFLTEIEDEFHVKIDAKTGAITKK